LATPHKSQLYIYSDSQAAIDGIFSILKLTNRVQLILRQNNHIILYTIKEIIKDKELDFQLIKVKGHSGNKWNDAADLIAKQAHENSLLNIDRCLDLDNILKLNDILFYISWNNFTVDRNIRNFNNLVFRYLLDASWSCNRYWVNTFDYDNIQNNKFEWNALWKYIKSISHSRCASFYTNNFLSTVEYLQKQLFI
jgi:ribonuclease HI